VQAKGSSSVSAGREQHRRRDSNQERLQRVRVNEVMLNAKGSSGGEVWSAEQAGSEKGWETQAGPGQEVDSAGQDPACFKRPTRLAFTLCTIAGGQSRQDSGKG
jgi:hypothetical protein